MIFGKNKKEKKEKGRSRYWDVNYLHESCFFLKKNNYFKILILAKYSIFIKVVTLRKKTSLSTDYWFILKKIKLILIFCHLYFDGIYYWDCKKLHLKLQLQCRFNEKIYIDIPKLFFKKEFQYKLSFKKKLNIHRSCFLKQQGPYIYTQIYLHGSCLLKNIWKFKCFC